MGYGARPFPFNSEGGDLIVATLKIYNKQGCYDKMYTRKKILHFFTEDHKIDPILFGCTGVDRNDIEGSMAAVSSRFNKNFGIQLYHFVVSIDCKELDSRAAASILGRRIIDQIGEKYQAVYAVHEFKTHIELHIAFNPVSFLDGVEYQINNDNIYMLQSFIQGLLDRYGIILDLI